MQLHMKSLPDLPVAEQYWLPFLALPMIPTAQWPVLTDLLPPEAPPIEFFPIQLVNMRFFLPGSPNKVLLLQTTRKSPQLYMTQNNSISRFSLVCDSCLSDVHPCCLMCVCVFMIPAPLLQFSVASPLLRLSIAASQGTIGHFATSGHRNLIFHVKMQNTGHGGANMLPETSGVQKWP